MLFGKPKPQNALTHFLNALGAATGGGGGGTPQPRPRAAPRGFGAVRAPGARKPCNCSGKRNPGSR